MIHESGEDYLEAILVLKNRQGSVRSVDLAKYMNYSKPSISNAVSNLRDGGYLYLDDSGYLQLTDSGMKVASEIYERHLFFRSLLEKAGIDAETADDEACKIEHIVSEDSFSKIQDFCSSIEQRLG